MIELQHIIESKKELLKRETYSRTPINYSEGMSDDQKDRYIQYLAEQNQEHILTEKAMELVLEDFVAKQKVLEERMSSFEALQRSQLEQQQALKDQLSEERKNEKPQSVKQRHFKSNSTMPNKNVLAIDGRRSGKRCNPVNRKTRLLTVRMKKKVLMEPAVHSVPALLIITCPMMCLNPQAGT